MECSRTCVSWCHSPAAQIHCSSDCCCQIPGRLWNWTLTPLRTTRLNPGLRRENVVEVLQFISVLHLLFKLSVTKEKGESRDVARESLRCPICLFCWQFILGKGRIFFCVQLQRQRGKFAHWHEKEILSYVRLKVWLKIDVTWLTC